MTDTNALIVKGSSGCVKNYCSFERLIVILYGIFE